MNLKTTATLAILFVVSFKLTASQKNDSLYLSMITPVVMKLDTIGQMSDIQACRNVFERIHQMYPEDWLSLYYIAYSDLKTFYNNPTHARGKQFLSESFKNIASLKKDKKADMSEILTLEGYYYTALIMLDPSNNGQKYFQKVFSSYEKAMKLNQQNPRPVCLLAFFEQQLPKMFRSNREPKEQYDIAKSLFAKQDKNSICPHWGENYLGYIKLDNHGEE